MTNKYLKKNVQCHKKMQTKNDNVYQYRRMTTIKLVTTANGGKDAGKNYL